MKQRIAAFTLVWAYVACALWLPRAAPDISPALYFFPPGYFFVVGFFLGLINEPLSARIPRLWVAAGLVALSLEAGVFLYGGHSLGLVLGLLFAIATACASLTARYLACCKPLLQSGTALGSLLILTWLTSPFWSGYHSTSVLVSKDGVFQMWVTQAHSGEPGTLHIGPRYGFQGAFGRVMVECGVIDRGDDSYELTELKEFFWEGNHTLNITGAFPGGPPSPSQLLPIPIKATQSP